MPRRSCALGPTDARARTAISLLKSYSAYYIGNYYTAAGLASPAEADDADEDEPMDGAQRKVGEPDLILGAAFGIDDVRSAREEILALAGPNIAEVRAGAGRGAMRERALSACTGADARPSYRNETTYPIASESVSGVKQNDRQHPLLTSHRVRTRKAEA